jgi:hypothetical protein
MKNLGINWRVLLAVVAMAFLLVAPSRVQAQASPTRPTAKAAAPIDLTGYWVAVIIQDWRWRMVTPAKGDYAGVPITAAAKRVGDTWDPAKDEAAGEQCKSYGAPGLMRAPTRLHVTWQDDNTLKVETDYGMQTRLLHFGNWKAPGGAATWQGDSVAEWETPRGGRGGDPPKSGALKVTTTHLRPGYLRKNGVPYSANAVFLEYWDLFKEANGDQRVMIANRVTDPEYLSTPWVTALTFKKEPNNAKWDPTPCSATW